MQHWIAMSSPVRIRMIIKNSKKIVMRILHIQGLKNLVRILDK